MGHNTPLNAADLIFEYPEGEHVYFDPCYGTVDADGAIVVYPGVNGNPAFLPFEARQGDAGDTLTKFVFDTKLTVAVLEQAGINANFWHKSKGEWVTE